jgi:hypothetical protein
MSYSVTCSFVIQLLYNSSLSIDDTYRRTRNAKTNRMDKAGYEAQARRAYWGVKVQIRAFFTSALGGPQNRYGRGGEEKSSQTLSGLEPPIIQPVAQRYTTELSSDNF